MVIYRRSKNTETFLVFKNTVRKKYTEDTD